MSIKPEIAACLDVIELHVNALPGLRVQISGCNSDALNAEIAREIKRREDRISDLRARVKYMEENSSNDWAPRYAPGRRSTLRD